MAYNPRQIEKKWQEYWEKSGIFETDESSSRPKFYCLDMFPYPSGTGLHVGHPRGYTATDIISRYKRMKGFNVLHPMGWDAFGLPAENYALKTGIKPQISTRENIDLFKKQIKSIGLSYDWSREINTTDPDYYKWTQWIFLQLFKKGLAYEEGLPINWCPSCKTGLANEEVVDGGCERCGEKVVKKNVRQWVLKITEYAERLLSDLEDLDWPEKIKEMQKNWIGKSEGASILFKVKGKKKIRDIEVFTTRADTLFGATFLVLAPEHDLIEDLKEDIENLDEIKEYVDLANAKSDLERTDLAKEKTGLEIRGIYAVNPVNGEEMPIWVADYVLSHYGYGAIMSVPAHDKRDYDFARKYGLPVRQVIASDIEGYNKTKKVLGHLKEIREAAAKEGIKFWLLGGLALAFQAGFIYRGHGDLDLIVKDSETQEKLIGLLERIGFEKVGEKNLGDGLINAIYRNKEGIEVDIGPYIGKFGLGDDDFSEGELELGGVKSLVISKRYLRKFKEKQAAEKGEAKDAADLHYLDNSYSSEGVLVNSGEFSGMESREAAERIIDSLGNLAKRVTGYKLRDWVFSRQRYWGEPIPLVHCEKCGVVALPEEDLPLKLPEVEDYQPTGTGESPLVLIKDWVGAECPDCGGPAKRETNTMPQWAGSCWYYLRFIDPKNKRQLVDPEKEKKFMPVDLYVGGAEHAVLHLLYSRFWHKFLYDIGAVSTKEPFTRLKNQGLILAEGGKKMSKSKGNAVSPDEIIKNHGADAFRLYEMFIGPFEEAAAWNPGGLVGMRRFLEKIWEIGENLSEKTGDGGKLLHQTIRVVSEDIENFKFNTAISSLMILANQWKKEGVSKNDFKVFLKILSPFAPHISEELWQKTGGKGSISKEDWPEFDPDLAEEEKINLIIQVNGKVRDRMVLEKGLSGDQAEKISLRRERVKKWIGDKKIKKIVFVKDKLINIVI